MQNEVKLTGPVRVRIDRDVTHFVRQWRKYRDMSIVQLGEAAGVSASMISQLETGKANYTQVTLESLAAALHVHPAVLLWTDPTASTTNWDELLQGWQCTEDEISKTAFNVIVSEAVKAACKAAADLHERLKGAPSGWRLT